MSAWYSAWLPSLPSLPSIDFTLPSSIQRRFISFLLKKSLGRFLKPGQLDVDQVDSQIGSGFVQVKDLELDREAINSVLSGLPIQLQDGSIASVTARIPWPNPLTSALGLSIQSAHLTFHLNPITSKAPSAPGPHLADSVVSVAESFVHDELSPREEAALRDSFHPDLAASTDDAQSVPGGLDPFLSNPDDEEFQVDGDPAGVSIFAALIERLLARFEFDASDTRITLAHPGQASLTLTVQQILYGTERRPVPDNEGPDEVATAVEAGDGETRTVSISGVDVTCFDLHPHLPSSPSTLSPVSPVLSTHLRRPPSRPISPASSSSSLDEGTQFLMTQSIVSLPPRSPSPTSSVDASMYQSALSTLIPPDAAGDRYQSELRSQSRTPSPGSGSTPLDTPRVQTLDLTPCTERRGPEPETILSFGTEPITIRLTTPASDIASPPPSSPSLTAPRLRLEHKARDKLNLSVTSGTIACALRGSHVRTIWEMANCWGSYSSQSSPAHERHATSSSADDSTSVLDLGIETTIRVRGIVMLLLPRSDPSVSSEDLLRRLFFSNPLVPPRSPQGYVRLYLEALNAEVLFDPSIQATPTGPSKTPMRPGKGAGSVIGASFTLSLSLHELSIFTHHIVMRPGSADGTELVASPLLITDHHLPFQYPPAHAHPSATQASASKSDTHGIHSGLPSFDLVDWTDDARRTSSARVSLWRTKLRSQSSRQQASSSSSANSSALSLKATRTMAASSRTARQKPHRSSVDAIEADIVPLHIFVDLDTSFCSDGLLAFVEDAVPPGLHPGESTTQHGVDDDVEEGNASEEGEPSLATPRTSSMADKERERRRLEKLVLDDLNLDLDYRSPEPEPAPARKPHKRKVRSKRQEGRSDLRVTIPTVRLQIRCASPPSMPQRSGALVLDLHGVRISNGSQTNARPSIRFEDQGGIPAFPNTDSIDGILASVAFQRVVVACSIAGELRATASLSIGPLEAAAASPLNEPSFGAAPTIASSGIDPPAPPLLPRLSISTIKPSHQSTTSTSAAQPTLVVRADIPSVHVHLTKVVFDAIQYWADDIAQFVERVLSTSSGDTGTEPAESRDTSLIGSRFFAKSLRSRSSESGSGSALTVGRTETGSEVVIKLVVSEAFVRIVHPRKDSTQRPFDAIATEVDVLMEFKPEGKDETVLTLGVIDLSLTDVPFEGSPKAFLSLTTPQTSSTSLKSMLKLRFASIVVPETTVKESRVKLTLCGFTYQLVPDFAWVSDLANFFKAPPGAFESVIPSERTKVFLRIVDGSIRAVAPSNSGALVAHIDDLEFTTNIIGGSPETSLQLSVPALSLLFLDDATADRSPTESISSGAPLAGSLYWRAAGYALFAEIADLDLKYRSTTNAEATDARVVVDRACLRVHMCADTMGPFSAFVGDLSTAFQPPAPERPPKPKRAPTTISAPLASRRGIMASVEEHAFQRAPEIGPAPDMISDDLPTNPDYLDESFGAAAGLREVRDEDLDEFDGRDIADFDQVLGKGPLQAGVVSCVGGETIKLLRPGGLHIIENYFETIPPESAAGTTELGETKFRLRLHNCDVSLFLYDGYDWAKTRKAIEDGVKEMRRRLAKIRQLVASGQTQDPNIEEETGTLLFNSVYIGLEQDVDGLEPRAIIAAIDEELNDDAETASQSSWQSLRPPSSAGKHRARSMRVHAKRLIRSKAPSIEFRLMGLDAEVDHYRPDEPLVSRTFATITDMEIFDHIRTSTWRKFLTELRSDSRGNIRETGSNMVRVELRSVRPVPDHPSEEARLRAKILPLRLYVDQDALDFLKKFFSFSDPNSDPSSNGSSDEEIFFQLAEVFPVDIKLDYKPRRVDYRALREGRTIELMNFFHFDGAEMTLRHITLYGISGWARLFDMLNDLWTPDVKATQLVDVISGVSPIRSVVNVGSGVADLVLLPIAQYKKDGRIVRGVQKGTTAFVKSTAMEAIKLGARLATGTQVILEQAEIVLGGQFTHPVTAETVQGSPASGHLSLAGGFEAGEEEEEPSDLISKYAGQPADVREGVQSAYRSLQRNLHSAAQTILAVPMEVYERSGNEGAVRAVIRAVPIAVLKPMIGASEAVSKTLMGLQNTLDPDIRHENEAKYKQR